MLHHAPREHGIDMQIVPDPLWVVSPRLVSRYRTPSHDGEIGKPGKRIRDLFRHSFTQVVHFRIVATIGKR